MAAIMGIGDTGLHSWGCSMFTDGETSLGDDEVYCCGSPRSMAIGAMLDGDDIGKKEL